MQAGFSLELIGVRRILEPAATALAAERIDAQTLEALEGCLQRMRDARSESDRIQHDADFHRLVAAASGNETLASMLNAVSSRTIRARAWRGIAEEGAGPRMVAQHQDILDALAAHDPGRAESAAFVHVATTEAWFRQALGERNDVGYLKRRRPGSLSVASRCVALGTVAWHSRPGSMHTSTSGTSRAADTHGRRRRTGRLPHVHG